MSRECICGKLSLAYERSGCGTPMLFIGGLGCDMGFWRPFQVPAFSKCHDVIVFDNRGVGGSDKPEGPYSIAQMADDAAALLSALDIDCTHVLGASMGGMIALELAIRHPGCVRSLIVACGIDRADAWMKAKQVLNQKVAKLPIGEKTLRELIARMNLLWMVEPSFFEKPEAVENVANAMQQVQQPLKAYCAQSQALHDHNVTHGLGSIKCPTLVMVGKQDILTPVRYAEAIVKAIPGAELRVIDGCGHLFMFEKPDQFNECVLDFLEDAETREAKSLSKDEAFEISDRRGQSLTGRIRRVQGSNRWALICSGLTGSLSRRSSLDELADTLNLRGWSSLRFDYRNSLKPYLGQSLRTIKSMLEDISCALSALSRKVGGQPDAVIARGLGARLTLEALRPYPDVPLIMWAPILWLRTALELRGRLHEMHRQEHLSVDGTEIGDDFIKSLEDPSDADLRSWIMPTRRHVIVHGEEDQVVPVRLAIEAKNLIENALGKVELYMLPGRHPHPGQDVRVQLRKIGNILMSIGSPNPTGEPL
jgi:3-oxoadipate enol-lactonase